MGLFGFGMVYGIVEHVLETSIHIFYFSNKTYKLLSVPSCIRPLQIWLTDYKYRTRGLDSLGLGGSSLSGLYSFS